MSSRHKLIPKFDVVNNATYSGTVKDGKIVRVYRVFPDRERCIIPCKLNYFELINIGTNPDGLFKIGDKEE